MKNDNILPADESASASLPFQASPSQRILVVEDDGDIRRLNAEVLELAGYQVDTAEDGEAGWKLLHAVSCYAPDSYDLLITDHDMPKVTGVELLKKLRAARMALPVIMATGTLPKEEFSRYPWLQPAATLLKPYTIAELLGTVEEVLHATDVSHEQNAPPSKWRGQPAAAALRS